MSEQGDKAGPIIPGEIRYIKLGPGGAWERASLDGGRIDWGLPENPHDLGRSSDWAAAKQFYIDQGIAPATATGFVRELRDFHTLGPNDLWITFARGHLWWAFAGAGVRLAGALGVVPATLLAAMLPSSRQCGSGFLVKMKPRQAP